MVKRELRFFDITQWKEEEVYLRNRHKEGWRFVRVNFPGIYTFEACEPQDVIYRLDYNQGGWPTGRNICSSLRTAAGSIC